ncbi:hypothetical protein CHU98_g10522 [Xylaria longipes]|nr:hypothetical protein CHU98_g10522 [Xylaria longipes]
MPDCLFLIYLYKSGVLFRCLVGPPQCTDSASPVPFTSATYRPFALTTRHSSPVRPTTNLLLYCTGHVDAYCALIVWPPANSLSSSSTFSAPGSRLAPVGRLAPEHLHARYGLANSSRRGVRPPRLVLDRRDLSDYGLQLHAAPPLRTSAPVMSRLAPSANPVRRLTSDDAFAPPQPS